MDTADAERVAAHEAHRRLRRVGEAARDLGDVAQPEVPPAGADRQLARRSRRESKAPLDAQVDPVGARSRSCRPAAIAFCCASASKIDCGLDAERGERALEIST